jgi:hypothetical protein
MTEDRIALCQLVEKSSDADLLRPRGGRRMGPRQSPGSLGEQPRPGAAATCPKRRAEGQASGDDTGARGGAGRGADTLPEPT